MSQVTKELVPYGGTTRKEHVLSRGHRESWIEIIRAITSKKNLVCSTIVQRKTKLVKFNDIIIISCEFTNIDKFFD